MFPSKITQFCNPGCILGYVKEKKNSLLLFIYLLFVLLFKHEIFFSHALFFSISQLSELTPKQVKTIIHAHQRGDIAAHFPCPSLPQ